MSIHDDYARFRALTTYDDAQSALGDIDYVLDDHDDCEHPTSPKPDVEMQEILRDQIRPVFVDRIRAFEAAYDTFPIDSNEMDDAIWELYQATFTADMALDAVEPTEDQDFDISGL